MVERAVAGFQKDSSLGVSVDILKTNTLKTHTDPHTVRGRPTLKMSSVFGTGRSANSIYYRLALRKQHNLQNALFHEDRFAKIHVLYDHLTYKSTQ